jgi:hypothetical protein
MCTASNRILCYRLCSNSEVTHKEIGEVLDDSGSVEADTVGGRGGVEADPARRSTVGKATTVQVWRRTCG